MRILREGDARLAAEVHVAHGHAAGGVGVRGDGDTAGLIDQLVRRQHIAGGACFGEAVVEHFTGHAQLHEHVFDVAQRLVRWEDAEDVEAERGGELEAGQHHDLLKQAPVLGEPGHFVRPNALRRFEHLEHVDFAAHAAIAVDRVVIGEGDHAEPAAFRLAQDVEIRLVRLLVVVRAGRVHVQVDARPGFDRRRHHGRCNCCCRRFGLGCGSRGFLRRSRLRGGGRRAAARARGTGASLRLSICRNLCFFFGCRCSLFGCLSWHVNRQNC